MQLRYSQDGLYLPPEDLSLLLFFRLSSAFLPSKSRPISISETREYDFFKFSLHIYYYSLLYIFLQFVLLLDITFLFLFLRDTDSRKGRMCPFCVPIHKKKKKSIHNVFHRFVHCIGVGIIIHH